MSPPTAIVTGGSSGIGLALTEYLIEHGWHIVIADINPPATELNNNNTLFIKTDVSSWSDQATLFAQAYAWTGRLDFCALNAGIDDRDDIFNSISPTTPPSKPNMSTLAVNFTGVYFGIKLAAHYMSQDSTAAGKPRPGGKIITTASAAGIFPQTAATVPQYAASKSALVGLVRALAPSAATVDIRINAGESYPFLYPLTATADSDEVVVCPALVATGLAPPGLLESFSPAELTPMSTIMRCFSELAELEGISRPDWAQTGPSGETVEGNHDDLIWHKPPTGSKSSSYVNTAGQEAWANAYIERNKTFAAQNSSSVIR